MTISHLLEEFTLAQPGEIKEVLPDVSLEEHQLEAFEQGYQAGWDDSAKAHAEEQLKLSADLCQTLQDINFAYREAYGEVMRGLTPTFQDIVAKLLPEIATAALPARVAEQIVRFVRESTGDELKICVSRHDEPALSSVVASQSALPVTVEIDPDLAEGQVVISSPKSEVLLETASILTGIETALSTYLSELLEETKHG